MSLLFEKSWTQIKDKSMKVRFSASERTKVHVQSVGNENGLFGEEKLAELVAI